MIREPLSEYELNELERAEREASKERLSVVAVRPDKIRRLVDEVRAWRSGEMKPNG